MGDGISVPGACHAVIQEIEPQTGLSMHSSGYRTCPRLVGRQAKFEKWRFGGGGLTVNGHGHGRVAAPEGAVALRMIAHADTQLGPAQIGVSTCEPRSPQQVSRTGWRTAPVRTCGDAPQHMRHSQGPDRQAR